MADVVGAYSNLSHPHKTAKVLRKLLQTIGSSTDARQIEEASPPRKLRRRLGQSGVEELVSRYQAGESVKQLSKAIDASGDAILRLLEEEEGVPRRFQPLTPKQLERVIELYEAGNSTYDIAEQLKIPKTTVGRALNKAGVGMRPRGRAARGK